MGCDEKQGVLTIEAPEDAGTWVINKQGVNQQIWWSSPKSGPMRFEYDESRLQWRGSRGDEKLSCLLSKELSRAVGAATPLFSLCRNSAQDD
jgi:frataxin